MNPKIAQEQPGPRTERERVGGRRPALLRESAAAIFFAVLSILMTWPLAPNLSTAVSDPGDPWLVAWILEWDIRGLLSNPGDLFHAPIFHPSPWALAFSENMFGIALAVAPLHLLGTDPLVAYNVAVLLGFALSGYGAWVLARMVTGSSLASLVAGSFFAFVPYRFDQLAHLQHVFAGMLPLLFAALLLYSIRPGWKTAFIAGAAFFLNGLVNIHWLLFGSFAAGASVLFLYVTTGRREWRAWLPLVGALFIAGVLLLPVLLPYRAMSEHYDVRRGRSEAAAYSATWTDWMAASARNHLYGSMEIVASTPGERALFPGLLSILFAASCFLAARKSDFPSEPRGFLPDLSARKAGAVSASEKGAPPGLRALDGLIVAGVILTYIALADSLDGSGSGLDFLSVDSVGTPAMVTVVLLLIRWWIRYPASWKSESLRETVLKSRFPIGVWVAILLLVVGLLGSLGMNAFLHQFLYEKVSPFRGLRVPARWAMIAYTGLSVLTAAGLLPFLRRERRGRVVVAGLALALLLFELRAAPIHWYLSPPQPQAYRWLADAPVSGALLELPIGSEAVPEQPYVWTEVGYVLGSAYHHKPLVNGFSGFEPPLHQDLARLANANMIEDRFLDDLEKIGTSVILVHADRLGAAHESTRAWLRRNLDSGRLVFIRRFEHDISGDYLFGIVATEQNIGDLRGEWESDPAGRSPVDNLKLFLAGDGRTYNQGAFGTFDVLRNGDELRGGARIHGWALAGSGVRGVNLRFQNGAVVIPATLVPRQDVKNVYPWYPSVEKPGFEVHLAERPDGVDRETDLQLEIIDGNGASTRLPPLSLTWRVR